MNPPAGDMTLDPGRGMAWVDEHGAHLVDYASCHLEPAPMLAAVTAALESCAARERPENLSDRAWLLSALRRECATGSGPGFLPASGPGGPDQLAVRRAWSLADPLGAETLRLLYRHELPLRDLVYVLALPIKEAGRLIARTQDVVEILVSGLDGLARGRPICPDIGSLVAAVFPDERREAADFGAARTELLRHIVTCVVCKRPINIRYTVPQILSRPPVADLTAETRQRLLDALNRARPAQVERTAHRPPSSFGAPLPAPVDTAPAPAAPLSPAQPPAAPAASAQPSAAPPSFAQPSAAPQMPPAPVPEAAFGSAAPAQPSAAPPSSVQPPAAPVAPTQPPAAPPSSGSFDTAPLVPPGMAGAPAQRPAQPPQALPQGPQHGPSEEPSQATHEHERPVRPFSQEDTQPSLPWPPGVSKARGLRRSAPPSEPSGHSASELTRQSRRPVSGARGPMRPYGPPAPMMPTGQSGAAGQSGPTPTIGAAGPAGSGGPAGTTGSAGSPGAGGTAAPWGVAGPVEGATHPAFGEGAVLPPGQDTPLYNALLSQIRAREALAHAADAVHAPADVAEAAGGPDSHHASFSGTQIRIIQVLARVGSLLRATALRIVIVVVAGAAGTVAGINLFAPAPQSQKGALEANVAQASADPVQTAANLSAGGGTGGETVTGGTETGGATDGATGAASGAPQVTVTATAAMGGADQGGGQGASAGDAAGQAAGQGAAPDAAATPGAFLMGAWGVQAPSVVALDAFGRGTLTLSTTSGKPVKWRISAPGLVVEPSSGTLKPGRTAVVTVRALRVRYWCGVPSPMTAPLKLHGPKGNKGTATVRWSTC